MTPSLIEFATRWNQGSSGHKRSSIALPYTAEGWNKHQLILPSLPKEKTILLSICHPFLAGCKRAPSVPVAGPSTTFSGTLYCQTVLYKDY
ncbi:hypothetical protein M422DRAFT_247937 [Sphaerobolus stellatus SS14]|nr:hypothetical protein M422DRAFT_247937 [Sphaerobolus stellatus SS14]